MSWELIQFRFIGIARVPSFVGQERVAREREQKGAYPEDN